MRITIYFGILVLFTGLLSYFANNEISEDLMSKNWHYSDLRLIDPIDSIAGVQDIVAVFCRYNLNSLQFRIDFLDLETSTDYDMYVFIDNRPGGNRSNTFPRVYPFELAWDYVVNVPYLSPMSIADSRAGETNQVKLRVTRDINQDMIILTIRQFPVELLSANTKFWVVVTAPGMTNILDQTIPSYINAPPPPPIQVELVFWNVLDITTPASSLRSWDGAHTGPQSSRHGLKYLVEASQIWNIPITLCGFNYHTYRSVVDYIDESAYINNGREVNLIRWIENCVEHDYTHLPIIDFSYLSEEQKTNIESLFLHSYSDETRLTIYIGEDLAISNFGSAEFVSDFFEFISRHPWIKVISDPAEYSRTSSPTPLETSSTNIIYTTLGQPIQSGLTEAQLQSEINAALISTPENQLTELAHSTYFALMTSTEENFTNARGSYLSQIGNMIAASNWLQNPTQQSTCEIDLDWDGQAECILASTTIFLTYEMEGGTLAFGFALTPSGPHQFLGPTSQFPVLRSDPSQIVPNRGIIGDGGQIPGAFADTIGSWQEYKGNASPAQLLLTSDDGLISKTFTIRGNEILVNITGMNQVTQPYLQIPIVLDPWLRFESGFIDAYWQEFHESTWIWGITDNIFLTFESQSDFSAYTFNATSAALTSPEDPNFDYTPGHLLPFPMAVIQLETIPSMDIRITIDQ